MINLKDFLACLSDCDFVVLEINGVTYGVYAVDELLEHGNTLKIFDDNPNLLDMSIPCKGAVIMSDKLDLIIADDSKERNSCLLGRTVPYMFVKIDEK